MSDSAPAARRPGRPARLSQESVLDAADALLSSEGAEAVTIRGNDLLLALVDRLAGRLEYPPLPALPRERLVRAGISQQGPSVEQSLRGAPDPERYPTLAS